MRPSPVPKLAAFAPLSAVSAARSIFYRRRGSCARINSIAAEPRCRRGEENVLLCRRRSYATGIEELVASEDGETRFWPRWQSTEKSRGLHHIQRSISSELALNAAYPAARAGDAEILSPKAPGAEPEALQQHLCDLDERRPAKNSYIRGRIKISGKPVFDDSGNSQAI